VSPRHVRHPTSWRERRGVDASRASVTTFLVADLALLALAVVVAGAGACGGSSDLPNASPSSTSTTGTTPLAGTLRAAAAEYWRLIDADDFAAVAAAGVPGEAFSAMAATDDIAHVRLMRAKTLSRGADGPGSALVRVDLYIDPVNKVGQPTPWGDAGEHQLFMSMRKAPQGGWLVKSWNTSP